jgi:hypothetical protein
MNPTTILEHPHIPFAGYSVAKLPKNRISVLIGKPFAIGLENTSGIAPNSLVKTM